MFGGGTSTEYEDIVNKATDENLTSENWELILGLCDKVQDEGQEGAHAAIAAILKRLAHRNPNVQLYALSLAESLSKNLGIEIHRELASRAFTQGLEKLIIDRNTHEKVRKRALGLIAMWAAEFEKDTTLGIMEECYDNLKAKNYKFEQVQEAPPPTVDDEIRRKEEEELQRVLEMSMQDKGGRNQWSQYSLTAGSSSSGAGASGSSSSAAGKSSTAAVKSSAAAASSSSASASTPTGSSSAHPFAQPKYQGGGYVPARTPSPAVVAAQQRKQQEEYHKAQAAAAAAAAQQHKHQPPSHRHHQSTASIPSSIREVSTPTVTPSPDPAPTPAPAAGNANIVTRVRALHTFEPTEPGELAFEKGDVIKVVDRGYKDWWRGQLKGRTGIFPVNYVEAMPEPTASELAREAEREAAVFAQAINVEKLLNMLRALDPARDNLADNEEIQELYRSSMALRPKIVKLIDKYSQKRADLVSMNETFVRARTIFDSMMEESLARQAGVYEQQPTFQTTQFAQARPNSRGGGRRPEYGPGPGSNPGQPQPYGWGPPNAYEQPTSYTPYPPQQSTYALPGHLGPDGHSPYGNPSVTPAPGMGGPQGIPPQQQGIPSQQGYIDPNAAAVAGYGSPQGQSPPQPQQIPGGYGVVPQGGYTGIQPNAPYTQQGPTPYPAQQQQQQPLVQPQPVQQQQPLQQPIQPLQAQQQQPQPIPQQLIQPVVQQQPLPNQQPSPSQQPLSDQRLSILPDQWPLSTQQPLSDQRSLSIQQPLSDQRSPPNQEQPVQQQPTQLQPQPIQQQPVQQGYKPQIPQYQEEQLIQPLQAQPQPIQVQPQPQPIQQQPVQQGYQQQIPHHQEEQPIQPLQAQPQPIQVQPQPIQQQQAYQQQIPQHQEEQPLQAQPQPIQIQPQLVQQQPVQQGYQQQIPQFQEEQPIQTQLQADVSQATSSSGSADPASPQALPGQLQPQPQAQSQSQVQAQPEPEPQPQLEPQPQAQSQPQQPISGPGPYVFNPSYTYADPNVQAWAQYYAQGGKDLAGSVYFISIPGVTGGAAAPPAQPHPQQEGHGGHHRQQSSQRRQSLQAQNQQVRQQQQPIESELAYTSGLTNDGGRAKSPVQHQQLQGVTRYQLSDQPLSSTAQSQQPQFATQYQQATAGGSDEFLPGQKQSSPSASSFMARPGTAGSYSTQTASTPSWVLPKKATPANGVA